MVEKELTFEQRRDRCRARLHSLQPDLARVALHAQATYEALRPEAKHVSTVDRNYSLRHQQVHGLGTRGPSGLAADYLMVGLGDHHDLVLYQNFGPSRRFLWQFESSKAVGNLLSRSIKLELIPDNSAAFRPTKHDLNVVTYSYPEEFGHGASFTDNLCGYFNDYRDAEEYIGEMAADLATAIERYGF